MALGQFTTTLSYHGKSSIQQLYVIKGLRTNLLGLQANTALNLAARVDTTIHSDITSLYPSLFQGLGSLGKPYEIKLTPNPIPHAIYTPRKVPLHTQRKGPSRIEPDGVNGNNLKSRRSLKLVCWNGCYTQKELVSPDLHRPSSPQQNVLRETHPLPKVNDTLAQISGAVMFSKLDANSGFWQLPLASNSQHLITFPTNFGRYKFNKLPFGICSAPEVFQKRMNRILEGLEGILYLIDDVLVFGKMEAEHNARLHATLQRMRMSKITLNLVKRSFFLRSVKFLGHIVDWRGVSADPDKISAITRMAFPRNITEGRRFLGMVNQFANFHHRFQR